MSANASTQTPGPVTLMCYGEPVPIQQPQLPRHTNDGGDDGGDDDEPPRMLPAHGPRQHVDPHQLEPLPTYVLDRADASPPAPGGPFTEELERRHQYYLDVMTLAGRGRCYVVFDAEQPFHVEPLFPKPVGGGADDADDAAAAGPVGDMSWVGPQQDTGFQSAADPPAAAPQPVTVAKVATAEDVEAFREIVRAIPGARDSEDTSPEAVALRFGALSCAARRCATESVGRIVLREPSHPTFANPKLSKEFSCHALDDLVGGHGELVLNWHIQRRNMSASALGEHHAENLAELVYAQQLANEAKWPADEE
jgi:hypothetical protein